MACLETNVITMSWDALKMLKNVHLENFFIALTENIFQNNSGGCDV